MSPLGTAVMKKNKEIVEFLINSGANVNNPNRNIEKINTYNDRCFSIVNLAALDKRYISQKLQGIFSLKHLK